LEVAAEDVDARQFEDLLAAARRLERGAAAAKLREALALWRGPALADFAYDDFAQRETERLEDLRLTAVERRIDLELALGHHIDLVPELEALVRSHPLDERLRGHLMVALYRSGRQADALEAYNEARTALLDGLGLEPSEELQTVQRKILAHDESLAPPPRAAPNLPVRVDLRFNRPLAAAVVGLAILGAVVAAVVLTGGGSAAVVVPPNSVARIDASGTRVESYVRVGRGPVAVAVGAGGVWVANAEDGTVDRLDPANGKLVANIGTGADVNDIAVGFGSVWVADGNDGTVTQIDPRLNERVETIPLGGQGLAPDPVFYVAVDSRYVWATRGDQLLRIDPRTNRVDGHLSVGTPTGLATGGGAVWVATQSERLLRIDPETAKQTDSQLFAEGLSAPAYIRGSLWVVNQGEIEGIDPVTLGVDETAKLASGYPVSLAEGDGAVWAIGSDGKLTRVTPGNGASTPLRVGKGLSAVAVGHGTTWAAVSATG
jgi:streptogramin lyase